MKTLKFRQDQITYILLEDKTSTWRLLDDKHLQAGDEVEFINAQNGEPFGTATLTSVREKKLQDIHNTDYEGHERFDSPEQMYQTYQGYYGGGVTPDSVVKIIQFKLR